MAARTREHELETESERAFTMTLPSSWVYRRQDQDYGIDGIVEVFEDGESTGETFGVQLKATDTDFAASSPTVRLKVRTTEYWDRLHQPTLVVLYTSVDKALHGRWWHDYSRKVAQDQESLSFTFDGTHAWSAATPPELVGEVRRYHVVRSSSVQLPLHVRVEAGSGDLFGLPEGAVGGLVRSVADRLPGLVAIVAPEDRAEVRLQMAVDHTRVDLGGGIAVELSHGTDRQIDELGFDGIVALATGLARLGLSAQAASLLEIGVPGASDRADGEFLGWVGRTFVEGHRVVDGVALTMRLLDQGLAAELVLQAATALAETTRAPSVRDLSEVADLLARCADSLVPQDHVAAEAWMRAAATARPHDPVKAIEFYQRAAVALPDLSQAESWLIEVGGAAHDADELDLAIASYRAALDHGQNVETYAALADSLLSAGSFTEAQQRFDEYHDRGGLDGRWLISQILLGKLLDLGYAGWEDAEAEFENRYFAEADKPGKPLSIPTRRALNWFNSGVTALEAGRGDRALLCFLSAVTLMPMDDEAWVQATIGAFNSGNPELFARVIEAGYTQRTYMYLDKLRTMSAQLPADYRGLLLDIVEEVAAGRAFPPAE